MATYPYMSAKQTATGATHFYDHHGGRISEREFLRVEHAWAVQRPGRQGAELHIGGHLQQCPSCQSGGDS